MYIDNQKTGFTIKFEFLKLNFFCSFLYFALSSFYIMFLFRKLLILENGHYALRLADIARQSGVETITVPLNSKTLQDALLKNSDVGAVMVVHCETSSGLVNQVDYIGKIVKKCLPGRFCTYLSCCKLYIYLVVRIWFFYFVIDS